MTRSPAVVVWLTGLPASGKSTLARRTAEALRNAGAPCCLLDSDTLRTAVFSRLGYEAADRDAFYESLAQLAALLARQELCVIVAATAHERRWRDRARALAPRFIEVHVATPPEVCAERDTKGLYRAAFGGKAPTLPGVGVEYQPPRTPEVIAEGGSDENALTALVALIHHPG
jgi:adenylylsulfate kinase